MLYQKVCFVGLSVYATLSRTVFGSTYIEYANKPKDNIGSCTDATASDRCIFHCDGSALTFDCYNAGTCDVYCEEKKCLSSGGINATNAQQLNLYASGDTCLLDANVYLPSHGSANISAASDAKSSFVSTTINAGTNTSEIYINCPTSGVCQNMHVNAQTAQLLYIDSADGDVYDGKDANNQNIVNCPSAYGTQCIIDASNTGTVQSVTINANKTSLYINANGGLIKQSTINVNNALCAINIANSGVLDTTLLYINNTLCTINGTNGGSLNNAEIYTANGYPHDVVFENIVEGDVSAKLYCLDIDEKAEVKSNNIFDQSKNSCFNSRNPTVAPTKYPSLPPTLSPSQAPSYATTAPTFHPSMNTLDPSLSPTFNPTLEPSYAPTFHPSMNTFDPSQAPTYNPSQVPTISPTEVKIYVYKNPTNGRTENEVHIETETVTDTVSTQVDQDVNDRESEDAITSSDLLYALLFMTGFLLIFVVFWYAAALFRSKSNKSKSRNEERIQEGNRGKVATMQVELEPGRMHKNTVTDLEEFGSLSKDDMALLGAATSVNMDGVRFETAIRNLQAVNIALIDDVVKDMTDSVDGLEVNNITEGFEEIDQGNNDNVGGELDHDDIIMTKVTAGGLLEDEFEVSSDHTHTAIGEDETPPPPSTPCEPATDPHIDKLSKNLIPSTPM